MADCLLWPPLVHQSVAMIMRKRHNGVPLGRLARGRDGPSFIKGSFSMTDAVLRLVFGRVAVDDAKTQVRLKKAGAFAASISGPSRKVSSFGQKLG